MSHNYQLKRASKEIRKGVAVVLEMNLETDFSRWTGRKTDEYNKILCAALFKVKLHSSTEYSYDSQGCIQDDIQQFITVT